MFGDVEAIGSPSAGKCFGDIYMPVIYFQLLSDGAWNGSRAESDWMFLPLHITSVGIW